MKTSGAKPNMHPMLITALVGLGCVLLAWLLWFIFRRWDRAKAIVAAASPLPIKLVNVWDPVWIRGEIDCPEPLFVPWFNYSCIHFTYRLEEEVVRTEKDEEGNTKTTRTWETRETRDGATPFTVRQGEDGLWVDAARAQWHYELAETRQLGSWRYSCTYLPCPGPVSVVGVVGEKKQTLEPLQHVPLMVTPRDRADYLKSAERSQRWIGRIGLFFLVVGFALAIFGLVRYAQTPEGLPQGAWWNPVAGIIAALTAIVATGIFWGLRTFNSLVIYRTRAQQSWSQIDVHLKQRYELIPNLVDVVKAYLVHEKDLLESLSAARSKALSGGMEAKVGAEQEAVAGLSQVVLRAEKYPDLKANQNVLQLQEEIVNTENKLSYSKQAYNDSVERYEAKKKSFFESMVVHAFAAKLDKTFNYWSLPDEQIQAAESYTVKF